MNPSAWFDDDDTLLVELASALGGAGPVPAPVIEAARAAFAWRDVDRDLELLSLVHDSARQDDATVRSAGVAGPRVLVFEGDGFSLDLEVASEIIGQVLPPQPCRVVLMESGRPLAEVDADALGCFRLARPERGHCRLTCRTTDRAAATGWVRL
jgi:hypothetical protein